MVRTIRWSETASDDLQEAARFIARDSRYYAASFVQEAYKAAHSLDCCPERGRVVPESDRKDVRQIFVKSYRLIYLVTDHEVIILAFIHAARDLSSLWKHRGI